MTVSELIKNLQEMPQDIEVHLWHDVDADIKIKHIIGSDFVHEAVMIIGK